MHTDKELIEMLSSSDFNRIKKATTFLYNKHLNNVRYLVQQTLYLNRDIPTFTHTILSEAILGLIKGIEAGRGRDNFGAYFNSIIKNKTIDYFHKEERLFKTEQPNELSNTVTMPIIEPTYRTQEQENIFITSLFKAFNQLKAENRHILCWHYYAQKSYDALANKVIKDVHFLPDLIEPETRREIEQHDKIQIRDTTWEKAGKAIHARIAGQIRQRAIRALKKLKEHLGHFDLEELGIVASFNIENLCQQYQNQIDNE